MVNSIPLASNHQKIKDILTTLYSGCCIINHDLSSTSIYKQDQGPMRDIFQEIVKINIDEIKSQLSHMQASNIINLIQLIADFQNNSPLSSVQQFRDYGVSGQEIIEFLSKLQAGELDNQNYISISDRLRVVRDTLLSITSKDKEDEFTNVNSNEDEDNEDAELSKLRILVSKMIAKKSDFTKDISRSERDLIAKSLLDYIMLKTVSNKMLTEQNVN